MAVAEDFSPPGTGGSKKVPSRVADREQHAQNLLAQFSQVLQNAEGQMQRRASLTAAGANGYYLEVEGRPEVLLMTDKLERGRKHKTELLAVKEEGSVTKATVFVPQQTKDFLEKIITKYRTETEPLAKEPIPKNWKLVEGIGSMRNAILRDLWTGDAEEFPSEGTQFSWEAWLRPGTEERFRAVATQNAIPISPTLLVFPEEVVVQVTATPEEMELLVGATLSVTRLQKAAINASLFESLPRTSEVAWLNQMLERLNVSSQAQNYLCILDTGIRRAHPLLAPRLLTEDCHSYRPDWTADDHHGHGTTMGGLGTLGDLIEVVNSVSSIDVPFGLESVKIYPPGGQNPHELLGAITAGGIARAELGRPERKRIFCLASSTPDDSPHRGRPSSWAAEIDQLCAGINQERPLPRMICVSAGNIQIPYHRDQYLDTNDTEEIESPGQAWNALTVGAYTNKVEITGFGRDGWVALAPQGDLSPTSRTSMMWESQWPNKPDITLEGGNLGVDPADNLAYGIADLKLLSTSRDFPNPYFETCGETSAATALAARICALIQSVYPNLWPETIRALVVNSAEWTAAMLSRLPTNPSKSDYLALLRRYGYGVPNLERALWSKRNSLSLVAEDIIQPFRRPAGKQPILNQMKTFPLPWPTEALQALETEEVVMKVTLSYFIEPNPSESARNRKSRYASHGLRFAVKLPDETDLDFRRRVNKLVREESQATAVQSDDGWTIGPRLRDKGSLQSDIWKGPASDLARRGMIAVYPISGWWKERPHLERVEKAARFSLVVSIETEQIETDIYTPITNLVPIVVG